MAAVVRPDVQVRAMRMEDVPRIDALETASYEFPWSAGVFSDCLKAGYPCWVLSTGRTIAGYGVLSMGAGEAHLLNLCIAADFRGCGLGRHLLGRLVEIARWNGAGRIFLEVRPSNPWAIALYQSAGFHEIGRRPRYYPASNGREEAIVMALEPVANWQR